MKRILLFVCALSALTFLCAVPTVRADVDDFVVNDFHARYELSNDSHGGRMTVTETIRVTFSDQNHGILRAIPTDYRNNSLRLSVLAVKRDGREEPYSTYGQANNEVLKIGDVGKTITGSHTYEIQYEMKNIIAFFDEYDEWYWDINGDQWHQPFQKVSGEVIMPAGWRTEGIPTASCYTGKSGSTQSICNITKTESGYTFASTMPLGPNETLTVATPFQKGLFTPRDRADWYHDNIWQFVGLGAGAALSLVAFRQWWRWGRDYKGRGVIVPEYEPPKNLSPAEVGLLNDYSVDSRDLTATLIDLAVRGYIKIYDEQTKTLGIFKSRKFKLELTNEKVGNLKHHERSLLQAVFKQMVKGTTQGIATINKSEMQAAVTSIRSRLKDTLTKEYGLIEESPLRPRLVVWGILVISFTAFVPITNAGWGWIVGTIVAGIVSLACGIFMTRRSHAGLAAYEKIKGLKLYMDTAEKDRLAMMQSVDRPFAEPSHTVDLFEKLLPYAVALGLEKSWAKQFENIYREPPSWYAGNYTAFNTVYFANSLAGGVSAFNSSFSTSTSSSSSGSGGGGFAGGGGGGGGGGGW